MTEPPETISRLSENEATELSPMAKKPVPWRGRPRVTDPKERRITLRITPVEYATLTAAAAQSGLSVGAYVRVKALGSAGPRAVRRPAADRVELARLLGLLGNYGSNLNQLARAANADGELPTAGELTRLAADVAELRGGVMQALGRERPRQAPHRGD